MSQVQYNNKWQTPALLFQSYIANGGLCSRFGASIGGTWGYALLGPDLAMSGGSFNSPPTATGPGWNTNWVHNNPPNLCFTQDNNVTWKRGHLVNGDWGGSGGAWTNLTPLTSTANSNHKTVESFIKNYLAASYSYETKGKRNDWYGVQYLVQCSINPWSHQNSTASTNLYSYAPAFIKVTWRAVSVSKPTNLQNSSVRGYIANATPAPVGNLPFTVTMPNAMANQTCLPATGNTAGGNVFFAANAPLVTLQNNGFDGTIEVHQS